MSLPRRPKVQRRRLKVQPPTETRDLSRRKVEAAPVAERRPILALPWPCLAQPRRVPTSGDVMCPAKRALATRCSTPIAAPKRERASSAVPNTEDRGSSADRAMSPTPTRRDLPEFPNSRYQLHQSKWYGRRPNPQQLVPDAHSCPKVHRRIQGDSVLQFPRYRTVRCACSKQTVFACVTLTLLQEQGIGVRGGQRSRSAARTSRGDSHHAPLNGYPAIVSSSTKSSGG